MKILEKIFTDFESVDVRGAKTLLNPQTLDPSTANLNAFKLLVNLLYPNPAGAFLHGQDLWNKIKEISGKLTVREGEESDPKKLFAKLIRVYYVDLMKPDKVGLENDILNFYSVNRKSATVGYTWNAAADDGTRYHENSSLRDMMSFPSSATSPSSTNERGLMYILVDSPTIDIKMRNADKAEVFLNYVPTVIASQMVPYMSAEFSLTRNIQKTAPDAPTPTPLDVMSPLRFLMGDFTPGANTADMMMYDAAVKRKFNSYNEKTIGELVNRGAALAGTAQYQYVKGDEDIVKGASIATVGMDMFTMPQTLINMDYRQDLNPRYNPVINPTLPFGTITSFSMNVTPSVGVMSFKTATMTLKIFDRSRLVEIADFINPKLYQAATVWITYGWIAPTTYGQDNKNDVRTYFDFINDNMLRREAYGVRNSGMTIENDGTVTVTLSLYTKAAQNILEATDIESAAYDKIQRDLGSKIDQLSKLAKRLGLQAFADLGADVRGSQLISSVMAGNLTSFDPVQLKVEKLAIDKALGNDNSPDAINFKTLLNEIYNISGGTGAAGAPAAQGKLAVLEKMDKVAGSLTSNRFSKLSEGSKRDLFADPEVSAKKYPADSGEISPFARVNKRRGALKSSKAGPGATNDKPSVHYGPFGSLSFGHVFAHYFSEITRNLADDDIADEFQVVFYKLNDFAGLSGGINIAEFPIDMSALEAAYAKRVEDQKSERMSFDMFLEVVRQSQFADIRHPAYGFNDLYKKNDKGELVLDDKQKDELTKRLLGADGSGPFTLPAIEFHIEAGYSTVGSSDARASQSMDLFQSFNAGKKSGSLRRVIRIHIYDKASSPHKSASRIFSNGQGYIEIDDEYLISQVLGKYRNDAEILRTARDAVSGALDTVETGFTTGQLAVIGAAYANPDLASLVEKAVKDKNFSVLLNAIPGLDMNKAFRSIEFKRDANGRTTFEDVKKEISRLVPTLKVGTNGSMIQSISYSTNQDALLSTIMMLRNTNGATNPSQPNGSADGTLPLRVVPGQLSVTTFGCPLVEYMQQFFVDLGTGTTVDNLYNVTGLTHNISPGKFTTEVKFTFADAYGQYESPQSLAEGFSSKLNILSRQIEAQAKNPKPK